MKTLWMFQFNYIILRFSLTKKCKLINKLPFRSGTENA